MNSLPKYGFFIFVIVLIAGAIWYLEATKPKRFSARDTDIPGVRPTGRKSVKAYPRAKEIAAPAGFLNSGPFRIADFVGKKVILVDFWTYSCINCQRTLPYLTGWWEKYKDQGLLIVGVHTPEFEFEKEEKNVRAASQKFGVTYPIVLDNDYGTWNAYANRYWPHKYLIDIDGYIVYDHIGEGAYEETERKIQELLEERKTALGTGEDILKEISRPAGASDVDFSKVRSPEIYFGSARNLYLGNGKSEKRGFQSLSEPAGIKTNILYLAGEWLFEPEYAEARSRNGKIIFRYQAKNVYLVANSSSGAKIKILLDGVPPGKSAGEDINEDGSSKQDIREDRLYKLIEAADYGQHTVEIIIENPGFRAYAFTFG
jgi:thiol-disulfide isomerase/thioredoxin